MICLGSKIGIQTAEFRLCTSNHPEEKTVLYLTVEMWVSSLSPSMIWFPVQPFSIGVPHRNHRKQNVIIFSIFPRELHNWYPSRCARGKFNHIKWMPKDMRA